jgi:hypothetical protein
VTARVLSYKMGGRCGYCGCTPEKLTVDHMHPVSLGGDDSSANTVACCFSCNTLKANYTVDEFRAWLLLASRGVFPYWKSRRSSVGRRWTAAVRRLRAAGLISKGKITFFFETRVSKVAA